MDRPNTDPAITLQAVEVLTGPDDHEGMLVFVDGRLAAVLVRLDGRYQGGLTGSWSLDVGFGPCEAKPDPFATIETALAWVAKRADGQAQARHAGTSGPDGEPVAAAIHPPRVPRPNLV